MTPQETCLEALEFLLKKQQSVADLAAYNAQLTKYEAARDKAKRIVAAIAWVKEQKS